MNDGPQQGTKDPDPDIAKAQADEQAAATEAMNGYLTNRVVALNVEIRKRDARIMELELDLANLSQPEAEPGDTGSEPVEP